MKSGIESKNNKEGRIPILLNTPEDNRPKRV